MEKILKDADLYSKTRALTLGGGSGMNQALDAYKNTIKERAVNAKGIYAYYQPFACPELAVGWALLTHESDHFYFQAQPGHVAVQVFVEEEYRRHGIGTALLKRASEIADGKTVNVYAFSNWDFFTPFIQQRDKFKSL